MSWEMKRGVTDIKIEQNLEQGSSSYHQVTDDIEEVPEGEEGAAVPPAEGKLQLISVETPHCLRQGKREGRKSEK